MTLKKIAQSNKDNNTKTATDNSRKSAADNKNRAESENFEFEQRAIMERVKGKFILYEIYLICILFINVRIQILIQNVLYSVILRKERKK